MSHFQDAVAFRTVFRQPFSTAGSFFKKSCHEYATLKMQLGCIEEEGNEFKEAVDEWIGISEACADGSEAKAAKAHMAKELGDLVYVCYQFAAFLRIDLDEVSCRIHASNMTKLNENGMPIFNEHGKVLKGPNYVQPNLLDLV